MSECGVAGGEQVILLFDSSHLNIGDLVYDECPVGSVAVGYHSPIRMTGQYKPLHCDGKRMRVYATTTCGFD